MTSNTETKDIEMEAAHKQASARILRSKDQDGFKLVLEMAEAMAEVLLYESRDTEGNTEARLKLLNKSEALAAFAVYVDKCVGMAEEEAEREEAQA